MGIDADVSNDVEEELTRSGSSLVNSSEAISTLSDRALAEVLRFDPTLMVSPIDSVQTC